MNREGIHRDGYYPQYLGGDDVDAALLMAPMVASPWTRPPSPAPWMS